MTSFEPCGRLQYVSAPELSVDRLEIITAIGVGTVNIEDMHGMSWLKSDSNGDGKMAQ